MNYSSYITIDDTDELSVCYTDVYIANGRICFLSAESIELPITNTWIDRYQWKPDIKILKTENELTDFITAIENSAIDIGTAIYGDIVWSGNIGHALLDGLYQSYLSLVKFNKWNDDFTFITNFWDSPGVNMALDVIEKFSRNKIFELNKVHDKIYRVKTLITGTGRTGNVVMREDYTLYGKKYNGMGYFRDRMRLTYSLNPNKPLNTLSPKMIIIVNKRYGEEEITAIKNVIQYYKEMDYNIQYVDWSSYKTFSEQLSLLEDVDIQISGPGTGMNYSPFLKPGAVSVNLGCIKNIGNIISNMPFPAYMEQAVGSGQDRISTVFYDRLNYKNIEKAQLIKTIDKAIYFIENSIILQNNHFIDAQIFVEYCKRVNNARYICNHLTSVAHFIEYFINEDPMIMPPLDTADIDLLRKLKNEYGYVINYK